MAIKYIGSKRKLIPVILRAIQGLRPEGTVIDLFSGTSRVGHALKGAGYRVLSNDYLAYAETIARCYVEADREDWLRETELLVAEFNALRGVPGYFTESFCVQSRFFQPKNGERIDQIRDEMERKALPPELKAILLVSLMEAADRVDSTTGLQMAYLKQWAPRAHNELELRVPELLPRARAGKGRAHRMDAREAVDVLDGDIAYIDPPYNQHSYLGNYHVWESLVLWDKPEIYGIACKRVDCRTRKSDFNLRKSFDAALEGIITRVRAPYLVVSFNNEGYISRESMERLLERRGNVVVIENDFKRYVGAQIGIFNPQGEKVGVVSHLSNKEYVYVVGPDLPTLAGLRSEAQREAQPSLFL